MKTAPLREQDHLQAHFLSALQIVEEP